MTAPNRSLVRPASLRGAVLFALTTAALFAGGRPRVALAVDDAVWNPATEHWYAYADAATPADWNTCAEAAAAAGGHLATITSAEEHSWILDNLGIAWRPDAWLGATDSTTEGAWTWTGGEAWTFDMWAAGEPSDSAGTENWLAMAPDGSWSDEPSTRALSGYVVEWDSDPNPQPPSAPSNLAAVYAQGAGVALTWNDASSDEQGFVVERMPAGQPWSVRRTTDADVAAWTDFTLFPATTYTYRVAALGPGGTSEWSNEVSVTTTRGEALPPPPHAPGALSATPNAAPAVELAWQDNSDDETLFDLERAEGGAAFGKAATLPAGTVAFTDDAVHPGWPYAYRIRALGMQGPSAFSNVVTATVPATLGVTMQTGTLRHATAAGRDTISMSASLAIASPAPGEALDPVAHGLALQFGPVGAPVVRHIAADDPGWKVKFRRGTPVKAKWKSSKGAWPKLAVTVDIATGRITLSAKRADFAADPAADMRLLVACGARCGSSTATWTQRSAAVLQMR